MSEIAKHWIDGEWTGSDTVSQSINPATGVVLGSWADGGEAEEQDHAVGRHIVRPAGLHRPPHHDVYPLGKPGLQRDHDVRLRRERGRVRRLSLQVPLARQSG